LSDSQSNGLSGPPGSAAAGIGRGARVGILQTYLDNLNA
jgi:hypothetical protein